MKRGKEKSVHSVYALKTSALVLMALLLTFYVAGVAQPSVGEKERLHKQFSVQIEPGQVATRKIEGFDWVTLPESSHISIEGHPALPMKPIVVKLPRNTEVIEISILKMTSSIIPGKYMIAPALKPRVISDETETSLLSEPLPEIYNSSIPYPSKPFDFYSSKGREYNYVMIYLHPVKFVPSRSELTLVTEATFDVEYTMEAEKTQSLDDPSLDEVIITAPAYETEANTLATWRNVTQIKTVVFTTDWIYPTYEGIDEPEKIRNFIRDMFNKTGIKYVLLFGDVDDVPTRYAWIPDGYYDGAYPDGSEVPTDYYYECLDGTWDPNGDGIYADLKKDDYTQIDFIPDVSVGRLSVDNATASHVVNKIIQYEKNIDPTWSKKMILVGADISAEYPGADGEILNDYITEVVQYNFTEFIKLYETQETLSASAISDNINSGSGAVNFAGHGHYGVWGLGTGGSYRKSDVANLNNGNKLPIVVTMTCLSAGFDSLYNPGNCIGEEFLRNPAGGSAAYVGATRVSWAYVGASIPGGLAGELNWRFWESRKLGINQPGPMLTEAKIRYIASHPLNTKYKNYYLDEKTVLEFVLLGDPALFVEKLEKPFTLVKTYKDSAYSKETKFFTINDAVYIEADARGYGRANISNANVYAELYVDAILKGNITLAHLGGDSSLYRGSWASSSSSSTDVYSVNVTISSPYEPAPGSNLFHLYPGSGASAYRLDWDEDARDDYILESEHLIAVFNGTEYTDQLMIHLYQKDTGITYTFRKISDPDSIGKGEITTTNMIDIAFYSFSLKEGENLAYADLEMKVNLTALKPISPEEMFTNYDSTVGASPDRNYVVDATESLAQQFIPDADITLTSVSLYVMDLFGYGELPLIVQIQNDDGTGLPSNDAADLLAQETVDALPAKNTPTWINVTFTAQPALKANTPYWIVLICNEPRPPYMGWTWKVDDTAPTYPGYFAANSGDLTAWTQYPYDAFFRAYGIVPSEIITSLNLTVAMRKGSVDYLVYRLHSFDQNISYIGDVFSDITGTLGLSDSDDRYHLQDGTDGLITSLTTDQWNNYAISNYVCVYDNSASSDPVNNIVMAWVRFNETQTIAYQTVGLWNDIGYATEGLRLRYNASQAIAEDEVNYILVFTKGNWQTIHQSMPTIESGQYPDPNFMASYGFALDLRAMDWDLTDSIQGAYVYVDTDIKISDANGWTNWTGITGTVYVKVKWHGAWVNGTFMVVMDSNKTINIQCNIFDIIVTTIESEQGAVLQYVNVTVYNATNNMIRTGITDSNGKVYLTNVPNSTLTFTSYDGATSQLVIANVTLTITTENQAETIICDQNSVSISHEWGIIAQQSSE